MPPKCFSFGGSPDDSKYSDWWNHSIFLQHLFSESISRGEIRFVGRSLGQVQSLSMSPMSACWQSIRVGGGYHNLGLCTVWVQWYSLQEKNSNVSSYQQLWLCTICYSVKVLHWLEYHQPSVNHSPSQFSRLLRYRYSPDQHQGSLWSQLSHQMTPTY